jgi:hypothetical protein
MTTLPHLTTTCPDCGRRFTLHGPVDLDQLNRDWFFCPWCAKTLELQRKEPNNDTTPRPDEN